MNTTTSGLRALYWTLQAAGWGLWCVLGLMMVRMQRGGIDASTGTGYALFFGYAIALSDLLRRIITRRGWLALDPLPALLRLAGAALALSLVLAVLIALATFALQGGANTEFLRPSAIGVLWWNLTIATVIWITLYAGLATWLRTRHARQQADALERGLVAARLKALEAQMSPHFLFNCLNSLRAMIDENPARAQDMVTRLANILRHNLVRPDAPTDPLQEQVDVVADYLALEAVRFEERLRVRIAIEPATRSCAVPAMLLQTLVENAIKHGIAHLPDGGEVLISSRIDDDILQIEVENTGTLRPTPPGSTQLGLANIRERLQMLHGSAANLELAAVADNRVRVTVRLPARSS